MGRYKNYWQLWLASISAVHQARDVVATVYDAAGATAIFNAKPFERPPARHQAGTLQGPGRRPIHLEMVGQILLSLPPEGHMFW